MMKFKHGSEIRYVVSLDTIDNSHNVRQGTELCVNMVYQSSKDGLTHIQAFPISGLTFLDALQRTNLKRLAVGKVIGE